jgi:hypothetical protein
LCGKIFEKAGAECGLSIARVLSVCVVVRTIAMRLCSEWVDVIELTRR